MGKAKKKVVVIGDDEYSVATDLSEEQPPVQEEKVAAPGGGGGKKKGKKGNQKGLLNKEEEEDEVKGVADDEEEVPEVVFAGKKKPKGKKGGGNKGFSSSNFGLLGEHDSGSEDDKSELTGERDSEGEDEPAVSLSGKKKSLKKGSKSGGSSLLTASSFSTFDDDVDNGEVIDRDEDELVIEFEGKKKSSKSGKKGGDSVSAASSFDLLNKDEEEKEDEDQDDELAIEFKGKKKSSKGGKKGGGGVSAMASFDLLNDDEEENEYQDKDDHLAIEFKGKKKSSKGGKKGGGSALTAASYDVLNDDEEEKKDEDDVPVIEFRGKKKSSKGGKKGGTSVISATGFNMLDENEDMQEGEDGDEDHEPVIEFSGKKKSSKKKGNSNTAFSTSEDQVGSETTELVEAEQPTTFESNDTNTSKSQEVAENSKNKKKKNKKSGRTAQEEDDLDKILAELGEGSPLPKPSVPPSQGEKVQAQPEPVVASDLAVEQEAEEEKGESAAAKKKKKKKEKEKEKKAAAKAAAVSEVKDEKIEEAKADKSDTKGKAAEKKVPKHVREKQEALARMKEAEEKRAREEEEKRRKEEEERRRQEELERQAEEAKRRRKEKEKAKMREKKEKGLLLTAKQKEERRRLDSMKNQLLANATVPISSTDNEGTQTKRPIYQKKKSKPNPRHANGAALTKADEKIEAKDTEKLQDGMLEKDPMDVEKFEETESVNEKQEIANAAMENGADDDVGDNDDDREDGEDDDNDDDDDDDWDAKSWDDVKLKVKPAFEDEEVDSAASLAVAKPTAVPQKPASSLPKKPEDVETKKSQPQVEVPDKIRKKDVGAKSKAPVSDGTPKQGGENLRSPICCIMGHVDTGKTKLLDCIRGTNVQEGEAGGITQQIGATYFPAENIRDRTKELKADATLKVPGLLVIDTPGHESFTNLRSRGSGLCDIAILVVDIMHGLEQQTIESLNLLKMRNTEFIVALNKVDRLYGWKTCRNAPIVKAMKQQSKDVQNEFNMRLIQIITQFKEQGLNTELYYKNKEMGETSSIVPTSAISGEGIPDLLLLLVQWTQKTMVEKLTFSDEVQCTVLEVKVIEGHGTTIDVVLVNGVLHEGDQIIVCGLQGPIVTTIRALLTPHPMKELRVKGTYLHHKEIKAAQGIKITAQGLEHAIAGTGLYVVGPDDDLEDVKEAAMEDMKSVMSRIDKSGEGVYVQASTLGSLEALLEFLKSPDVSIPVSGIGIGPVHKKDVMKASVMLEKKKEYATILAFDVKVTPEARELADELGVKIFIADIIYHLFDQFKAYIEDIKEEKKREAAEEAVFPCVLKILQNCIFNKKDPIVLGVDVLEGIAKVGTPICIPQREFIDIGRIASIENNHKAVQSANKGQQVAIKIVGTNPEEQQKMFGRHFELEDELVSHISRRSIDILKDNYRDELSIEEWKLVVKLKNLFKIQ